MAVDLELNPERRPPAANALQDTDGAATRTLAEALKVHAWSNGALASIG